MERYLLTSIRSHGMIVKHKDNFTFISFQITYICFLTVQDIPSSRLKPYNLQSEEGL
jgi:hypothetical protein